MKKLMILFVLTAMLLTACQSATQPETHLEATVTEPTVTEPTEESTVPTGATEKTAEPTEVPKPTEATEETTIAETQKPTEAVKPTEAPKPIEAPKPTETQAPTAPPHTHIYKATVTAPTCNTQGYTTHTCSCGDSNKDSYTNATGHAYTDTVVAATETEQGYTKHTCSNCGDSYKDSYTPVQRVEIITEADIRAIQAEACAYAESIGLIVDPTCPNWTASCVCDRYSGGYMTREEGLAYIRKCFFGDADYTLKMGYSSYYPIYWADGDDWRFVGAFWW